MEGGTSMEDLTARFYRRLPFISGRIYYHVSFITMSHLSPSLIYHQRTTHAFSLRALTWSFAYLAQVFSCLFCSRSLFRAGTWNIRRVQNRVLAAPCCRLCQLSLFQVTLLKVDLERGGCKNGTRRSYMADYSNFVRYRLPFIELKQGG